jgi:dephospho-CoA kinase
MKIIHVWLQEEWEVERLTKRQKIEDLKSWDSTRIYNSGRISGATDKGIDNRARWLSTLEAR